MSDKPVNGSVPNEVGGEGPYAKKLRLEAELKAAADAAGPPPAAPLVEATSEPEPEAPKKSQRASSRFG